MKVKNEPEMGESINAPEGLRVKIVLRKHHFPYGICDKKRLAGHAELLNEWCSNKTKGFEGHAVYLISSNRGRRPLIFPSQFVEISQPN